jgi:hypothetical protein
VAFYFQESVEVGIAGAESAVANARMTLPPPLLRPLDSIGGMCEMGQKRKSAKVSRMSA